MNITQSELLITEEQRRTHPVYAQHYDTRPRTCTRPSCTTVLETMNALCPACQDDLDGTLAEIVALQAEAKKERLARQGAQS